jgi:hypothetical protein
VERRRWRFAWRFRFVKCFVLAGIYFVRVVRFVEFIVERGKIIWRQQRRRRRASTLIRNSSRNCPLLASERQDARDRTPRFRVCGAQLCEPPWVVKLAALPEI